MGELFFDFKINTPIEIETDRITEIRYALNENNIPLNHFEYRFDIHSNSDNPVIISHDGTVYSMGNNPITTVHYYEYKRLEKFSPIYCHFIGP
ncbi:MAG: hypothetical protein HC906_09310 [Bacteroidales bacterium]|nr:hypothetical protein [Bacteroidales bacterium]